MPESIIGRCVACWCLALLGVTACGSSPLEGGEDAGEVELTLVSVPAGVQCVRLVASSGVLSIERSFPVVAAQSSVLSFAGLPTGASTISGAAYNQPCDSLEPQAVATWVATPVSVYLEPLVPTSIRLDMSEPGIASVNVDFRKHDALYLFDGSSLPQETSAYPLRSGSSDNTESTLRCRRVAAGLGLPTSRAIGFLSYGVDDQIAAFPGRFGVRTDLPVLSAGLIPVANDWVDLMDGALSTSLLAAGVLPNVYWYSGSNSDGSVVAPNPRAGTGTCNRWRASGLLFGGGYGTASAPDARWIQTNYATCGLSTYHLLCLGYTP